ncbi:MAG: hypothetical protein LBI42_06035 [Chitinispirillales bacterium]|jgi:hypothetical protein|nr:hypothetical protein [Chitinispirillales bacterium]
MSDTITDYRAKYLKLSEQTPKDPKLAANIVGEVVKHIINWSQVRVLNGVLILTLIRQQLMRVFYLRSI